MQEGLSGLDIIPGHGRGDHSPGSGLLVFSPPGATVTRSAEMLTADLSHGFLRPHRDGNRRRLQNKVAEKKIGGLPAQRFRSRIRSSRTTTLSGKGLREESAQRFLPFRTLCHANHSYKSSYKSRAIDGNGWKRKIRNSLL